MTLSLDWKGHMQFTNGPGSPAIELHSSTPGVTSPPQALLYAMMGCMAMDVVHVLTKGRHPFTALSVRCDGQRAHEHPRRFVSMALEFDLVGAVEPRVVERAVALSREKYCSVWHTIRPDVELTTTVRIRTPHADG